ncbi:aldo/keto reductase [Asticcacaulis solisilvae]|uniref:aldo/keto reductase n=1 Tax=Asticcacaulis solisilvae TaxID=1217274 RepID=UPI003FD7A048
MMTSPPPDSAVKNATHLRGQLGFGTASLGNLYRAIDDETAHATVAAALDAGITHFDTAPHYGQGLSERRVADALLASGKPFILSTKVGRRLVPIDAPVPGTERHGFVDGDPFEPEFDYSYDGVMAAFEDSRKRLKGARVSVLLAHDIGRVTHGDDHARHLKDFLDGGYRAMRALKDQGVIDTIGLGVNEWQICEEILAHADLDVVLLAGRYTLLEQTALDSFLPLCVRRKVSVLAAGPFNSGILTGGDAYNYSPAPEAIRAKVKALKTVCEAHGVSIPAAALQFPLAHPAVTRVVAGMASPAEVAANASLFATVIPPELWDDLKSQGLLRADAVVPEAVA